MLICELSDELQQEFEQVAGALYDQNSTQHALMEAIESWLAQHRQQAVLAEERMNNAAFEKLRPDLEESLAGKWIMIAHGKLQGSANSPDELDHLAPDALHRIVVFIGQPRPQEVEFGWQMTFA